MLILPPSFSTIHLLDGLGKGTGRGKVLNRSFGEVVEVDGKSLQHTERFPAAVVQFRPVFSLKTSINETMLFSGDFRPCDGTSEASRMRLSSFLFGGAGMGMLNPPWRLARP